MSRYYFDVRDGDKLRPDDEGCDLSSFEAMREEAAVSLAEIAVDAVGKRGVVPRMSIEVRDDRGPVLAVKCTFEIERLRQPDIGSGH